jgi:hypothetical protein
LLLFDCIQASKEEFIINHEHQKENYVCKETEQARDIFYENPNHHPYTRVLRKKIHTQFSSAAGHVAGVNFGKIPQQSSPYSHTSDN